MQWESSASIKPVLPRQLEFQPDFFFFKCFVLNADSLHQDEQEREDDRHGLGSLQVIRIESPDPLIVSHVAEQKKDVISKQELHFCQEKDQDYYINTVTWCKTEHETILILHQTYLPVLV